MDFQKLSVLFTDWSTKEHEQNFLNSLKFVKDMPKTHKKEREASTQRNIQEMNELM